MSVRTISETVGSHDAGALHVDSVGSGPGRTLYLHAEYGPDADHTFVDELASALSESVLVPHHGGFGSSAVDESVTSVTDLALAYLDLIDRIPGDEPVDVVGSSLGGWIAMTMAVLSRHRIGSLVLIGPVGVKLTPADATDFIDVFALSEAEVLAKSFHADVSLPRLDGTTDEDILSRARDREALVRYAWEPYFHHPKLRRRIRRVDVPTMVVAGQEDHFVRAGYHEELASLLPSAELVPIAECGHFPAIESPGETARRCQSFLRVNREEA